MACSSLSKQIDIEDLLQDKNKNIDEIRNNIPKYKSIIRDIYKWVTKTDTHNIKKVFHKKYNTFVHKYHITVKKNYLVFAYRLMIQNKEIENIPIMWKLLQKRPSRNSSGVTIITLLTSPHPDGQNFSCKHNCYYCPDETIKNGADADMPRSYLKKEPAVARGYRNGWDACSQMNERIHTLFINGHEIDKLEIIIEGGTYTEYPEKYLERFHRDIIYTANTYFDDKKRKPLSIEEEIEINATAKMRIIGICVETRPDALFDDNKVSWLIRFRKWGITRVQLGVQHTDNYILKKINRGHTIEDSIKAIQYLKNNGFKVDIHLMPDLPFSSPEKDKDMFDFIFKSYSIWADQIKIYPCEVTSYTVIKKWHESGKYQPYAQTNEKEFKNVIKYAMEICPPWIRLPRIVRDIPLSYIQGGNMYPNLRQMLNNEFEKEKKISMDIRVRECYRHPEYKIEDAGYIIRKYYHNNDVDYFISLESKDKKCLFGFIRLRVVNEKNKKQIEFPCLENMGLIRELHVYGNVVPVGYKKEGDTQHKGIGKQLLKLAEEQAYKDNCIGTAVISGIGVIKYYEKRGYHMENTYMIKRFSKVYLFIKKYMIHILFILISYYVLIIMKLF